jgi:stage III sporulation protein SpoIIIAA
MIEAVENHMPECIVIDEIGTELEAMAACTIAQRGVQLVGTAHGMTVENLIKNPSLQDLVGGIQAGERLLLFTLILTSVVCQSECDTGR